MSKTKKKPSKKQSRTAEQKDKEIQHLPEQTQDKLEKLKGKIEKFKGKVLAKFDDYVLGITLLPPSKDEKDKEKVNILLLIDDSDSKKMSKEELKEKLSTIIKKEGESVDKNLNPEVLLLTELWQNCYDAKYDLLGIIASSAPIHDKGMLAAIKIAEVHKSMVIKKFEKYIVCYVLAGSLVQGKATPESDVDVFLVIDDTDVKKMSRAELKDKLRAIIYGMGKEAGSITGIENKINIQPYLLTDFWESIKEANPVIFTFLRDGIPFYDRGIFMPWKQLLQMGRIKPSPESIDMFMHSGDQFLDRVKFKLKEIGMEDFFWACITTSQAAIMLYGLPPPTPKEAPEVLRHIFVKKEKLLEEKYVKMFEHILKVRKDMEHGSKKDITGKEIDVLYDETKQYLERLKKLFSEIQQLTEKEQFDKAYDDLITTANHALLSEGIKPGNEKEIYGQVKKELGDKRKIPKDTVKQFEDVIKYRKDYKAGKLTRAEVNQAVKTAGSVIRVLLEHEQRVKSREIESARIRVKHGDKQGEIVLFEKKAFVIKDLENPVQSIYKADFSGKELKNIKQSNTEELEKAITSEKLADNKVLTKNFFNSLGKVFGEGYELIM